MPVGEFDLIDRYFRRPLPARGDVRIGIGDDGALLQVAEGQTLVSAMVTLSDEAWAARDGDPGRLGRDIMRLALGTLSARGARPAWTTLALTLPDADEDWLAAFSDALFAVAAPLSVALVGGDTTRGPFTVTLVAHGLRATDAAHPGSGDR